ncbi:hypothetical protein [Actinomadura parmotrematis]|uniref:Secreted protein n=1 Tax=Actinomadura parmotrematis TaxID=2864039 RepID=A0ABS7FTT7_9ACTN|nr:hypothetical protein [Actinomadura parmotrematis]MBW8483813.1 hypothetical protein [Actinomadura parmotrematis]
MTNPTPRPARRLRRSLTSKALAAALVAPLAPAAVAAAATPALADPSGVAFDYADCPDMLPVGADPGQWICENIVIPEGSMKIGSIDQPLTAATAMRITAISGTDPRTGDTRTIVESVKSAPMTVAGGALGIPGSDDLLPLLKLQVQPVYAGNFTMRFTEDGMGINSTIDLRIKVINALMDKNCSVGTAAAPVKLNLNADMDTFTWYDDALGVTVHDNAFSAPATSGCGLLAPIADLRSGLPSASGKNSATFRLYLASKSYTELFPTLKSQVKTYKKVAPLGEPKLLRK